MLSELFLIRIIIVNIIYDVFTVLNNNTLIEFKMSTTLLG